MKKKKTSSKKTIRSLRRDIEIMDHYIERLHEEIDKRNHIIRTIGSEEHLKQIEYTEHETKDILTEVRIRPEQYGDFMVTVKEMTTDDQAEARLMLVENIARGLIDSDVVRFIYKDADSPLSNFATLAAKITVIPWYELVERK